MSYNFDHSIWSCVELWEMIVWEWCRRFNHGANYDIWLQVADKRVDQVAEEMPDL
jgi:hypothetical protein